jgi:hypothetical protein
MISSVPTDAAACPGDIGSGGGAGCRRRGGAGRSRGAGGGQDRAGNAYTPDPILGLVDRFTAAIPV